MAAVDQDEREKATREIFASGGGVERERPLHKGAKMKRTIDRT